MVNPAAPSSEAQWTVIVGTRGAVVPTPPTQAPGQATFLPRGAPRSSPVLAITVDRSVVPDPAAWSSFRALGVACPRAGFWWSSRNLVSRGGSPSGFLSEIIRFGPAALDQTTHSEHINGSLKGRMACGFHSQGIIRFPSTVWWNEMEHSTAKQLVVQCLRRCRAPCFGWRPPKTHILQNVCFRVGALGAFEDGRINRTSREAARGPVPSAMPCPLSRPAVRMLILTAGRVPGSGGAAAPRGRSRS